MREDEKAMHMHGLACKFLMDLGGPFTYDDLPEQPRADFWDAFDFVLGQVCTDAEKQILKARYIQGYTYNEIGKLVGVSDSTAKSRINKALRKMRAPRYRVYFSQGMEKASSEMIRDQKKMQKEELNNEIAKLQLDIKFLLQKKEALEKLVEALSETNPDINIVDILTTVSELKIEDAGQEKLPISSLEMSSRLYNILKRHQINTVADLMEIPFAELASLRWMGNRSLKECIDIRQKLGVNDMLYDKPSSAGKWWIKVENSFPSMRGDIFVQDKENKQFRCKVAYIDGKFVLQDPAGNITAMEDIVAWMPAFLLYEDDEEKEKETEEKET